MLLNQFDPGLFFVFVFLFGYLLFCFKDEPSLSGPGWPGACGFPASASQVLVL
jgi:hypothetical protein